MVATILSLATAVPEYAIDQHRFAAGFAECMELNPQEKELLFRICRNTKIQNRYSVIPDYQNFRFLGSLYSKDFPLEVPKTSQRNEIYKKEAPLLAIKAAKDALSAWGGDPRRITHVVSVSCTGSMAPGIEFLLIESLGLNPLCKRFGINFMGCFGAFQGIALGSAFAKESQDHRVLMISTELCSLHMQASRKREALVSNSLFSDGAGALVIGCRPDGEEKPIWEIHRHASLALPGSRDQMTWEAGDHGFLMKLNEKVPEKVKHQILKFMGVLLENGEKQANCQWAVHPGGKAILEGVEDALGLKGEEDLAASWHVLKNYGNMSSATFLFVLQHLLKKRLSEEWSVGVGFGPGLSFEGVLLKNVY